MMDEKKHAVVTVVFWCGILIAFLAAGLLGKDRLYSEKERRVLAQKPALNTSALLDGSYKDAYEEYAADQFPGRDKWLSLKTDSEVLLGKRAINGIYLGEDGYLFEQHLPWKTDTDLIDQRLTQLKELSDKYHAKAMLVPTADQILTDKLPAGAPVYDQSDLIRQAKDRLGEQNVIDPTEDLKARKEESIYYRTDHHWTTLGAYYGYLSWKAKTGSVGAVHFLPEQFICVSDTFCGTLGSRINLSGWEETYELTDRIFYAPQTQYRPVEITYDLKEKRDSLYEEKYLETGNQYGFFLDDNHAIAEIETGYHNGRQLFLIKDSYANCLIPFLTVHYEKITAVDLRYYNGSLFSLIEQKKTPMMDVLVLYNCIHFIEEFRYY